MIAREVYYVKYNVDTLSQTIFFANLPKALLSPKPKRVSLPANYVFE